MAEPVSQSPATEGPQTLSAAAERALQCGSVLEVPQFETTPEALRASMDQAIHDANARLDTLAALPQDQVTFDNTIRELDHLLHPANLAANRIFLIKETSTDAAMREQATELIKSFQEWAVGLDYREDVYRSIRAYADQEPELEGEDARLFNDTLRD